MTRKDFNGGGYTLTAAPGFDLVALAPDNTELSRTKEVTIPTGSTAIEWTEAPELPTPPPATEADAKASRIAELVAELATLNGEAAPQEGKSDA